MYKYRRRLSCSSARWTAGSVLIGRRRHDVDDDVQSPSCATNQPPISGNYYCSTYYTLVTFATFDK